MNRKLLSLWLAFIAIGILTYASTLGSDLTGITQQLSGYVENWFLPAVVVYALILSICGLTLIPSTPLLFIGIALFPPHATYWLNMLGILLSCLLVIAAIHRVGIDTALSQVTHRHYLKIRDRIDRNGYYAIVLWSFFPFAPTDAIVYVASSMGVSRKKIVAGVLTGEAILNAIYVYGAGLMYQQLLA